MTDPEAFLYIFARMLKSEGYPIKHEEGKIRVEIEDNKTEIGRESQGLKVSGDVESFISHMSSVLQENENTTVESLESLGFRFPEQSF